MESTRYITRLGLIVCVIMLTSASAAFSQNVIGPFSNLIQKIEIMLAWDAPINNTDGTPLTDLAGFNIWMAHEKNEGVTLPGGGTWINISTVPPSTQVTQASWMGRLDDTNLWFEVTAFDARGNESWYSGGPVYTNFVVPDIMPPDVPTGLQILELNVIPK